MQEELYPPPGDSARDELDDTRLVDLDVEEESPFLRGQKRVSARRPTLPKKAVHWLKWSVIATVLLGLAGVAATALYAYGEHNWRFRIESSDDIEIDGTHNVPHAQVMEVLGGDIGRNIFFIPLAGRKAQLEKIPWVESASVMRFAPNRLVVEIHERRPIAFARLGSRISLIDAGGTLMELPIGKQKYSFPVIVGMNPGEPLSTRAARMRIYNDLLRQLDSDGSHYSQELSEVDISDQEDVKVLANDPAGAVLVHLGSSDFLPRYKVYVTHLQGWRQQFDKLESVDLRYEHQIIVNPDNQAASKPLPLTPAATKAAMAAGVKPAALIHVITPAKPSAPIAAIVKPAPTPSPASTKAPAALVSSTTVKISPKPAPRKVAHKVVRHRRARKKTTKPVTTAKTLGPPASRPQAQMQAHAASDSAAPAKRSTPQ